MAADCARRCVPLRSRLFGLLARQASAASGLSHIFARARADRQARSHRETGVRASQRERGCVTRIKVEPIVPPVTIFAPFLTASAIWASTFSTAFVSIKEPITAPGSDPSVNLHAGGFGQLLGKRRPAPGCGWRRRRSARVPVFGRDRPLDRHFAFAASPLYSM